MIECRYECVKLRRTVRLRGRRLDEEMIVLEGMLKMKTKELRREIRKEKREKWGALCKELEKDIWGEEYKIVMRNLRGGQSSFKINEDVEKQMIAEWFPRDDKVRV